MPTDPPIEEQIRARLEELETLAHPTPPPSASLERVARSLDLLARFVLATPDEPAVLTPLAERLESVVGGLPGGTDLPNTRFLPGDVARATGRLVNARGTHPLVGSVNPVAPPIDLRAESDAIVGEVEFDLRFEGNVGWVHGGFIAAGFDIVVVAAARLSGRAGPTGTLTVRYRKPTPTGVRLRYTGRLDRVEGRKVFVEADLRPCEGDGPFAEASGIVVVR